jgi:hypothetical protein
MENRAIFWGEAMEITCQMMWIYVDPCLKKGVPLQLSTGHWQRIAGA